MMTQKTMATFECKIVKKEFLVVGESITANYPQGFPDAAFKLSERFDPRRGEIKHAKNMEVVISPYMCNDIMATYFSCLEVDQLDQIPEGMVGFKIPETEYAVISCSNKTIGEGYNKIFQWMHEKGYKQKWFNQSFPIEIFYYEDNVDEERAEILIPIQQI